MAYGNSFEVVRI